jgi:hypothetical protein
MTYLPTPHFRWRISAFERRFLHKDPSILATVESNIRVIVHAVLCHLQLVILQSQSVHNL